MLRFLALICGQITHERFNPSKRVRTANRSCRPYDWGICRSKTLQVVVLALNFSRLVWYNGSMKVVDDDGNELPVPVRFVRVVRWLLTEAACEFEDRERTGQLIIHIGRGGAPPKAVLERHHTL